MIIVSIRYYLLPLIILINDDSSMMHQKCLKIACARNECNSGTLCFRYHHQRVVLCVSPEHARTSTECQWWSGAIRANTHTTREHKLYGQFTLLWNCGIAPRMDRCLSWCCGYYFCVCVCVRVAPAPSIERQIMWIARDHKPHSTENGALGEWNWCWCNAEQFRLMDLPGR